MGIGFDLSQRPWVPVQGRDGPRLVGLRELFVRAHEFADLAVALPPAASGLWRVLYAVASRVTGLDAADLSFDEWEEHRDGVLDRGRFDEASVDAYFAAYRDRFDLFDARRPWLQDPRLAEQCGKTSGVNKLAVSRPAGSNQVWFGHHDDADPELVRTPDAVLFLLAWLYYGPSGRCTARAVGSVNKADTSAGPLRRVVSYHPVGGTVFESLVTGLVPSGADGADLTPWESDRLPEPVEMFGAPPVPAGFRSAMTGRAQHALLLTPSADGGSVVDARITWAWRGKGPVYDDPYLVWNYSTTTGEYYPRRATAERALWRDLDALLREASPGQAQYRRPRVFEVAESLPDEVRRRLRVRAFGFDQDGQTRDRQWFGAVTPPVLRYLARADPDGAARIASARQAAEAVRGRLAHALRQTWQAAFLPPGSSLERGKECPWERAGDVRYWPAAEQLFWRQADAPVDGHPAGPFVHLADDVFDQVTDPAAARPRVARAREQYRRQIWSLLPKKAA